MEEKKISFTDLSIGLKIPIIMSWVVGVIYAFLVIAGFIMGITGGV